MFISRRGVPISTDDDPENIIWIKDRLDVGAQNGMLSALTHIRVDSETEFDYGAFNTAMLRFCILRWEGPAFKGIPCTPENIERLDPKKELVLKVSEELSKRVMPQMGIDTATEEDGEERGEEKERVEVPSPNSGKDGGSDTSAVAPPRPK